MCRCGVFFLSSGRRHTRCALVTGVQTCALPISVRRLIRDGHSVAFCDRDEATGNRLSRAVGAEFIALDATDAEAVAALFRRCEPFDILVNNVGADQHAFFTATEPKDWRTLLSINLESAFAFALGVRSEAHTSELQSLMRISYAVFCLKKKTKN